MKSRGNWDSTLKVLQNLKQIRANGERQVMKSPVVDFDLTDDDDTVSKIEITDALFRNKGI